MSEKCQKISIGAHRIVCRVKINLANIGYPNGRYQEVPPKKPPNQKMLLSFFTQGVLRVPDLILWSLKPIFFFFCKYMSFLSHRWLCAYPKPKGGTRRYHLKIP